MSVPTQAAARAGLYGLFSRLWARELDRPLVEALRSDGGAALFPRLRASDEWDALADTGELTRARFDADYALLTAVDLVPYASFFLRPDGMVESGAVNPVVVFMTRYGFEVDLGAARALAPDHLAIELELAHVLCVKEAEAETPELAGRIRAIQRELLADHVLAWAPVYLFAAARVARTVLYREAAEATVDFLAQDLGSLT